jgi:hypothetical protein
MHGTTRHGRIGPRGRCQERYKRPVGTIGRKIFNGVEEKRIDPHAKNFGFFRSPIALET